MEKPEVPTGKFSVEDDVTVTEKPEEKPTGQFAIDLEDLMGTVTHTEQGGTK